MKETNLKNIKLDGLQYYEKLKKTSFWEDYILFKYYLFLKKYPGYTYLWFGSIISIFGDFFSYLSCIEIINKYLPNSTSFGISLFMLCETLPSSLVSGISGLCADTFDRRKIMFISDLLRSIFSLGYLWIDSEEKLWILYFICSIQSICGGFFGPSRSALIPNTISNSEDLLIGNSLSSSIFPIAFSLGSGFGALILTFFGTKICFFIDSFTYILSSICILKLFFLGISDKKEIKIQETKTTLKESKSNILKFISLNTEIFGYFYKNLDILWISLTRSFAGITYGSLELLHLIYFEEHGKIYNSSSTSIGIYYISMGITSFFAPMIITKYCKQTKLHINIWICLGFFIEFLGNFFSSFAFHYLWVIFFGAIIRPIGECFIFTLGLTYLQRSISDSISGRIFSFNRSLFTLSKALTSLSIGFLSKYGKLSNQSLLYIMSSTNGLFFLLSCIYLIIYFKLEKSNKISKKWSKE